MLAILIGTMNAQGISLTINTEAGRVDNLFGSRSAGNQYVTGGGISLAYYINGDLRIVGSYNHSEVVTARMYSSSQMQGSLQWRNLDSDQHLWYAGLTLVASGYANTYSYYDHSDLIGYLEWKYRPDPQRNLRIGYDLRARSFPEEDQASNTVHRWYSLIHRSFNTGTSIQLGANISIQDFRTPPVTRTGGRDSGFSGIPPYEELATNALIAGNIRISQSLHPRAGLAIEVASQRRLNRDLIGATVLDGLTSPFIDEFRWDGYNLSGRLNLLLSEQLTVVPSLRVHKRYFVDVPVYLYDFDTNAYFMEDGDYLMTDYHRKDLLTGIQIQIKRSWKLPFSQSIDSFTTNLTFGWNQSQSNDPLFDYAGRIVTVGILMNYE
ncbi:hypothetical protein ACFL4K_02965 [Candidatus Neomarinimicrobiota bacterium]